MSVRVSEDKDVHFPPEVHGRPELCHQVLQEAHGSQDKVP